ncbi:MAG: HNH endonuclease [Alphaproteobacteria bacterium]|nr:HNH endonuclease [Alphaproteobacteria bacterium]
MPQRPPVHRAPGHQTEADRRREADAKRGSSNARGYGSKWQRARKNFLAKEGNQLCVYCLREGRVTEAKVVDHKVPHKNDPILFWDSKNWQPLCKPCHDSVKRAEELSGKVRGADIDGMPLDPSHPWAKARGGSS